MEEERKRETAELKERINQISQWKEMVNGRASAVTTTDRQSEDQRQNLSEVGCGAVYFVIELNVLCQTTTFQSHQMFQKGNVC